MCGQLWASCLIVFCFILASCSVGFDSKETCSDDQECNSAVMLNDKFERKNVLVNSDNQIDELTFWWRKIINDQGKIISGLSGNNVDVKIFSEPEMGPGSDDGSALYFYGRQGWSIHNIYLVSQTFNLSKASNVKIEFKYLPIDLEQSEYLRLEVCKSTPENCGVGDDITVEGLNSTSWEILFDGFNGGGTGLDGKNHTTSDWRSASINYVVTNQDRERGSKFIFRFNVRMNDGFKDNLEANGMDDGVGLDEVKATAYGNNESQDDQNDQAEPDPSQGIDPFDPSQSFNPEDPRLFN